jgi:hypothetical protein
MELHGRIRREEDATRLGREAFSLRKSSVLQEIA